MTELEANGNFVRVKNNRGQRVYLTYVLRLLQGGPDKNGLEQPPLDSVTISAMGKAIPSAVNIAEIVKRRVVGLHQVVSISSETIVHTDEDAQDDAEGNRAGSHKASVITIRLSKQRLNTKDPGYQAPLPESMVTPEKPREERQRRPSQGAPRGGPRRGGNEGGRGGNEGGRGGNEGGRGGPRRGGRGFNEGGRGGNRGGNRGGRGSQ